MKHIIQRAGTVLLAAALFSTALAAEQWAAGMKEGTATFKSMGPLAFGPDGILFIADTRSAAVVAIDTGDTKAASGNKALKVEGINQKIAGLLGTAADQILIDDLVVNPLSRNVYIAVSRGRGPTATPVLVRVTTDGQPGVVSLEKVKFSRGELPDAPIEGVVTNANRKSNPRQEAITDIAFFQDRVLIAGLSNEEFASTLRAIPFPFKTVANGTTVEIYHGAHGRFETRAPVRTFVPFKVGNEPQLLAAYTCTPLVQISLGDLKPGAKLKGKTIAELGNRNRPLDMIVYQKDGKDYLLLANSSRGIMKIGTDQIENMESITAPVKGDGTKGLPYETIESWKGIDQLDRYDDKNALVLRRGDTGVLNLESLPLP
ncbi:MAG TPA: hypothetical protein VK846_15725 [Candidatus Limnocylindria bacterium]|nr:hypothetical protein [Candidatus Limnocylindria bacterium]